MKVPKSARLQTARNEFKRPVSKFEKVDLSKASFIPKGMTRAYRNTRYMVMVYDNTLTTNGEAIQILVQKHDDTPIMNHWREMYNIKNEIFGHDVTAIEYYPAKENLIDDHNIYWMWIFPDGIIPKKL